MTLCPQALPDWLAASAHFREGQGRQGLGSSSLDVKEGGGLTTPCEAGLSNRLAMDGSIQLPVSTGSVFW